MSSKSSHPDETLSDGAQPILGSLVNYRATYVQLQHSHTLRRSVIELPKGVRKKLGINARHRKECCVSEESRVTHRGATVNMCSDPISMRIESCLVLYPAGEHRGHEPSPTPGGRIVSPLRNACH